MSEHNYVSRKKTSFFSISQSGQRNHDLKPRDAQRTAVLKIESDGPTGCLPCYGSETSRITTKPIVRSRHGPQEDANRFQFARLKRLIEVVNFEQGIACSVIDSAHDSGVRSGWQPKHDCRIKGIWRREVVPLDIDGITVALPVVVAGDRRSARVVDRKGGIAKRLVYPKRSQRWAKGAHDDGPASHVSNNEPANEKVIARADESAAANVGQFRGVSRRVEAVNLRQANAFGAVSSPHDRGIGARHQCLQSG